ncbi:hypothetical protein EAH_00058160 [Eimeria acervulina]|uniref:Uncharacterized protein n=1 Tax=Eimeria acervulina TaxID=5801 RepID=U6GN90_EIMAC|nr:hypothetical protein EAH_00058160 [Eimeria acervulina]CDI81022.1 hypothetical protein EAH_00058160 [Eimeria acervulina]
MLSNRRQLGAGCEAAAVTLAHALGEGLYLYAVSRSPRRPPRNYLLQSLLDVPSFNSCSNTNPLRAINATSSPYA